VGTYPVDAWKERVGMRLWWAIKGLASEARLS